MAYRYWCGDCGFKTPWGTESQGAEQHLKHYASRHPRLPLEGQVETGSRNPRGIGCVQIAGLVVLLLITVALYAR